MLPTELILKDLSAYLVNKRLLDPKIKDITNYDLLMQIFLDYINNVDRAEHIYFHKSFLNLEQDSATFQLKESEITLPLKELNSFDSDQLKEFLYRILTESAYK
ncbi:hypothetical protein GJV03_08210 [Acinetobacter sp. RIT698]|nr:hypothetical protein [Acinetobacter sp. RIT698]MRT37139.1 hypothetical protein [Acinetobacter sp. RIT698]